MAPKLEVPRANLPTAYETARSVDRQNGADMAWQKVFAEPRLQRLISAALEQNHDLKLAVLNAQTAQTQFKIQRASALPTVDASASYTRERSPTGPMRPKAATIDTNSYTINLASYEIDLFGRVQSMNDAAFQRYLSTDSGTRSARITLIATVAEAYLSERLSAEQMAITERTLKDWQQSLKLTKSLYNAAQASQADLSQAEAMVYQAEADLEGRKRDHAQAINALTLVVGGKLPDNLPEAASLMEQKILTEIPAGTPSDLLLKRPDIVAAEHDLRAANADIGASRAAFFPRLSLTANYGGTGRHLDRLFSNPHHTWSFAPQITQPIFHGGALKGDLRLSEIRKSAAIVSYEKAIATAFKEVSDGLAAREVMGRQVLAQKGVVEAGARRLKLADQRYRSGFDSRLDLLDAQRSDYAARQAFNDLKYREYVSAIGLYRALGGGLTQ